MNHILQFSGGICKFKKKLLWHLPTILSTDFPIQTINQIKFTTVNFFDALATTMVIDQKSNDQHFNKKLNFI